MLCNMVMGESNFDQAMKNYVRKYQYSNVDHDDLINEMIQVSEQTRGNLNIDIKEFVYTWIKHRGFPLISVTMNSPTNVLVAQKTYLNQPNRNKDDGYLWEVPLTYITSYNSTPAFLMLRQVPTMTFQLSQPLTDNDWILVNYNLDGYYRVNYDEANWKNLAAQLKADHEKIPVHNRAQLIDDSFSLSMSGNTSQILGLKVTEYLSNESDYLPWSLFKRNIFSVLRRLLDDDSLYNRLQNYVVSRLRNNYDTLGWNKKEADNMTVILLRRLTLDMACIANYTPCVNEALSRFRMWRSKSLNGQPITPDQQFAVYCAVASSGTYEEWQVLLTLYKAKINQDDFKTQPDALLKAMTICTRNATTLTWLLKAIQNFRLPLSSPMSSTDYPDALLNIATSSRLGYQLTWKNFRAQIDIIMDEFVLTGLANAISTTAELDKFESFLDQRYGGTSAFEFMQKIIPKKRKLIQQNINWRQRNGADIISWLTELNF